MRNPNDIIDEYLVLQCQAGNKQALVKLVKRWHPKIVKQASWHTGNQEIAKDIAQECWGDILKGLNKLKNSKAFKVWVYRIIHRRSIDWIRQKQKLKEDGGEICEKMVAEDDMDEKSEQISLLQKQMRKMPNEQRVLLKLFYLESLAINEIAIILSIPEGTVKSRLHHARKTLQKQIKMYNHEK